MNENNSIRAAVRKMMTDARVVAALSDPPPPPLDPAAVRRAYERLWYSFQDALRHIEYLEVQLTHYADLRWRN